MFIRLLLPGLKFFQAWKLMKIEFRKDGRFSAKINDADIDFRVSTFSKRSTEKKLKIRVFGFFNCAKILWRAWIGKAENFGGCKRRHKKPYGMIFVYGAHWFWKNNKHQYAILRSFKIKDGVKYCYSWRPNWVCHIWHKNQSQVKPEIGYTFANGLRQILRQDPNIIMIGEIRDEETASLVINAALTGLHCFCLPYTQILQWDVVPRLIWYGSETIFNSFKHCGWLFRKD